MSKGEEGLGDYICKSAHHLHTHIYYSVTDATGGFMDSVEVFTNTCTSYNKFGFAVMSVLAPCQNIVEQ